MSDHHSVIGGRGTWRCVRCTHCVSCKTTSPGQVHVYIHVHCIYTVHVQKHTRVHKIYNVYTCACVLAMYTCIYMYMHIHVHVYLYM